MNCSLGFGSEVMSASLNVRDKERNCCIVAMVGPAEEGVCQQTLYADTINE